MNWRDLLYFSRGERRALTVLTCLITAAWITLLLKDTAQPPVASTPTAHSVQPTSQAIPADSTDSTGNKPDKPSPASKPKAKEKEKTTQPARYSRRKQMAKSHYRKTEKYPAGTIVELNRADTTSLKKVPGIGSTFARRIVKYRNLLGGFYTVEQLSEVYGIDEERYEAMKSWFSVDASLISQLKVNQLPAKKLAAHPYINYRQAQIIERLVRQKRRLSGWENLRLLDEFTEADRERLLPYLSFE